MKNIEIKKIIYQKLSKLTKKKIMDDYDIKDLGIDSLDLVELVVDIEEKYDISISDEELKKIKKVKDIINIFQKIKNKK